jgi:hypothetical protein
MGMTCPDGVHLFSQDGGAALTRDFVTGERRGSKKSDIEKMALISDALTQSISSVPR